jgi:hypothetical protein
MTPEDHVHASIERLVRQHPLDLSLVSRVSAQLPARGRSPRNRWLLYGATAVASATLLVVSIVVLNLIPGEALPIGPAPTLEASARPLPSSEGTPLSTPSEGLIEVFLAYRRHEELRDPSLDRFAIQLSAHAEVQPGLVLLIADYQGDSERFVLMAWQNNEWQVASQGEPDLLPFRDEAAVFAQVVDEELGLPDERLAVYGPLPNGPIGQLELEVDGFPVTNLIDGDGAFLLLLPAGSIVGPEYRFLDLGTQVLGEGEVVFR